MALRDRLLGNPTHQEPAALLRGLRFGSEAHQVRCLRLLGEMDEGKSSIEEALSSESPAIRRAAAYGLSGGTALQRAWEKERTEEGLLVMSVAMARGGAAVEGLEQRLEAFHRRKLNGYGGWVEPAAAARRESPVERFRRCLGDRKLLRKERLKALETEWEGRAGRQNILDLAALQHPDDFERLQKLFLSSGRRGEHAIQAALGIHGDPRAVPLLKQALFATDVDPGRGFAQRRLAAIALGRVGLRNPFLLKALEYEALDYEGRPGAGLGIQYPVRTDILEALGEIQDPQAIPVLLSYLGNIHGSAFGGFYLAAMDALTRFGPSVIPALKQHIRGAPEVDAANGVGVLAALGEPMTPYLRDSRRLVAEVAARAG